jgi:putative ABC transport system permease protein
MHDIHFALRTARKSPGVLVATAGTLALAIGANTAIFSIVSGVLLRPLPFADPDQLVQLGEIAPRMGTGVVLYSDLAEWRKQSTVIQEAAAFSPTSKRLLDVADPERIQVVSAERGLFHLLGAAPMIGRTFREDDPLDVVVLSPSLWRRRCGGDASCIGRKIAFDGQPFNVIGVMPETFQFPYRAALTEAWIPWSVPPAFAANRNLRVESVAARLKTGVTIAAARRELALITNRLEAQYPDTIRQRRVLATPMAEVVAGRARTPLLTLLGAVGLVLFIACANVANILLARAARRTHEIAVRAAIGASRGRLIRQLLTESLLLSLVSGLGGLFIAIAGTRLLLSLPSSTIPRAFEIGLDWRVFAFLAAASVGTGLAFGLVPALSVSRISPQMALKQAGGLPGWTGGRLRDGLVVAEIAISFVLLVSAGLLLRAFLRLQSTPVGLVADNVLTLRLTASLSEYAAPGSYGRYLQELEDRVQQVPGVRAAGFIQYLPLQNWGWGAYFSIAGRTPQNVEPESQAELRYVSPGYFEALRIPLRRGRFLTGRDTVGAPRVILVNEALARKYFPNEDPIGRSTDRGMIVGVVGDVRTSRLDLPAAPEIYYAFAQNAGATADAGVSLVVRTQSRPEALAGAVRETIHQVNPRQVIYDVKTMEKVIANSLADMRLYVWLTGLFAGLAVLLAVSGVYGVIAYAVAARSREFGIRLALGARQGQILGLVLAHGAGLVACGMLLGVGGTLAAGRLLESLVSGVAGAGAATLAAVAVLLAGAAIAACLVPARRAMQVDPNIALKYE